MSKPKKKPISENKKHKSKITNNKNLVNGEPRPRKNAMRKTRPDDGIAKSRQLAQKIQTSKSGSYCRPKTRISNKDDELRLCGNGKPMPSLSELEKMFDDSDDDGDNKEATPNNTTTPSTPKKHPKPEPEQKLMSPTTISDIANRVFDLVSNISDPTELLEDEPRPAVIKPKKRRKPDEPYIVGCKDRPRVPERPCLKFCKGDDKFGPDSSADEDDDLPNKRAKRGKKVNISKSIFNAKSDEIAARLKECDKDSDGSTDSNKTVAYTYYTPINSGRPRSFSPLPSTSRDNETFVKNDERFNESLISENISISNLEDDIEIIATPCETIEINDGISFNTSKLDGSIIEITDDGSLQVDDKLIITNETVDLHDDDSLQVVDVKPAVNDDNSLQIVDIKPCPNTDLNIDDDCVEVLKAKPASPILVEDYYSNLDIDNIPNDDICEVIDIDDIIAENKAIIEKYSNTSTLDTVTLVDTSYVNTTVESNYCDEEKDSNLEETVKVTEPAVKNIIDNSKNSLTNEQDSIICVNTDETSHRPMPIVYGNEDIHLGVEVIDDSMNHPNLSDNTHQNRRAVESVQIDLEYSLQNNSNRSPQPRNSRHPTGTELREDGSRFNVNCDYPEERTTSRPSPGSKPTTDTSQHHLKIINQFFKKRNRENRKRKSNKQSPRLSEDILSQHFISWLQSMTNNSPTASIDNSRLHPRNQTPSPALTTTDSPDKTGKRIGDCPICMDSLSNKPIVSTICGHVFCMNCIKLSIKSNGNKCPTCRKALKKGTGYHQIFL